MPRSVAARTVLLVDHGPALRTIVHLHLGKRGAFDFVEARDGAGAAALLGSREVHLVIAEVGTGHGRALIQALRAVDDAARGAVPVVLVGSDDDLSSIAAAHPPCAVARTPVTWPRLRAAIAAVLPGWP